LGIGFAGHRDEQPAPVSQLWGLAQHPRNFVSKLKLHGAVGLSLPEHNLNKDARASTARCTPINTFLSEKTAFTVA
jgi:hypothetical protein